MLTAGLLVALLASPSASAQEAVEEPAGEAADFEVVETSNTYALDQPSVEVAAPLPLPTPTPLPSATPAPAAGARVAAAVIDNRFQPSALNVAVGSTVTWTNNGNNMHTLTSPDGLFDSGGLLGGQTFSFTFTRAGSYRLICRQHSLNGMASTVVVQ